MEIQASLHTGDAIRCKQWRSEAGADDGDPHLVYTREIQSQFTYWRSESASHKGDPKPLHTM